MTEAVRAVTEEILSIMRVYHEQEQTPYGVDTPGGLEHMGDVWKLFLRWEQALLKEPKHMHKAQYTEQGVLRRTCAQCGGDLTDSKHLRAQP